MDLQLPTVVAQIIYDPGCRELEEGSWLWWYKGCWIFAQSWVTLVFFVALGMGAAWWQVVSQRELRPR